ncbi:MAG: efflux RND transporter permease subunit, partial [Methylobacterium sp.]|nr:efflux RND transporter permease subunit [Methylobacterium sp.]
MGISGRIARFFLRNQITPLLGLLAVLLGIFAVLVTPREEEPQINVTLANVMVPFPGASAREVESLISTPAEQVLARIAGVEHVYSVSRPGLSIITVQYEVGEDQTKALVNLYDTIFSRRDWLSPELGAGEPVIKPIGIDDVPIVALTLWTDDDTRGAFDLERVAHALEIELKRIRGTREVTTIGGPDNVVRVLLDADRLSAFGIATQDVRDALQVANASQPAGTLVRDNREILVQTGAFLTSGEDVKRMMVGVRNGKPVFMSDIARIEDGPDQPSRYVWAGSGPGHTGGAIGEQPAVTLAISKKPGENAVDISRAVTRRVEQLRGTLIPEGIQVTVTRNYGETANDKAQKLIGKLGFATASVVLLVLFALGRREAVVVGVAVVLTLAATLFASWAWGFTINRVSLFALIFSIGILVDDAIVVVENIHRRRELEPHRPFAAIIPEAVDEVGGPTILATFTVIAALLPMAFVTGLMGPYMSPIPINSSLGMLISLAVAFVVTPWLSYKLLQNHAVASHETDATETAVATDGKRAGALIERMFTRLMTPFLQREQGARNRRLLGLGIVILIALSLSLAGFKLVILKMLPFDNKSEFQVVVDMPVGTALENTAAALREMTAYLSGVPEVADYVAYAGTASPINFNGLVRQYFLRNAPYQGDIQVNLVDKHRRSLQSHDIAVKIRPALQAIADRHGADLKVVEVPPGPPVLSPIVAEVYGPDDAGRLQVARAVRAVFEKTPGIVDADDSSIAAAPRTLLLVDRQKA